MIDLETLIHDALERNASDIHLTVGEPPIFRLDGELTNFGEVPLTEADTTAYVQELITPGLLKEFHEMGEADFAVTYHDLVRMRCNVFRQRVLYSYLGLTMRNEKIENRRSNQPPLRYVFRIPVTFVGRHVILSGKRM